MVPCGRGGLGVGSGSVWKAGKGEISAWLSISSHPFSGEKRICLLSLSMGNSQKRVEGSPNLTCLNPVPPVSFLSGCAVTQAQSLEVIPESPSGPSPTRAQQTPLLCCVPAAWPWFRPLFSPVRVALTCRLASTHILPAPQRALKCPSRDVRPLLPLKTSGASQAPQGTTPAA